MLALDRNYNDTVKGLVGKQGLHGKVERFQQLSIKANKDMPALEALHDDLETDRLESLSNDSDTAAKAPSNEVVPTASEKVKPIRRDTET